MANTRFEPMQIMCEINGYMVPAIIDTGAEISVMSASCARRCHLTNQIDPQYAGKATGVGSCEIVGGIDALDMRIGPVSFQNKISILYQSRCDLLIGLDILRRFDCELSFKKKYMKLSVRKETLRVPLLSNDVYNPIDDTRIYSNSSPDSKKGVYVVDDNEGKVDQRKRQEEKEEEYSDVSDWQSSLVDSISTPKNSDDNYPDTFYDDAYDYDDDSLSNSDCTERVSMQGI